MMMSLSLQVRSDLSLNDRTVDVARLGVTVANFPGEQQEAKALSGTYVHFLSPNRGTQALPNSVTKSATTEPSDVQVRRLQVKLGHEKQLSSIEVDFLRAQIGLTEDKKITRGILYSFQWQNDPSNIPYVTPFLAKGDPQLASAALSTPCWLGDGGNHRAYMSQCLEPGMPWDPDDVLAGSALTAAGLHLRTHKDHDVAQPLAGWQPRPPGDPLFNSRPFGRSSDQLRWLAMWAGKGMGYAVGADPLALTKDKALMAASVKRFLAKRQGG